MCRGMRSAHSRVVIKKQLPQQKKNGSGEERKADCAKMMTNIYIHLNVIVKNVQNDLVDIQSK